MYKTYLICLLLTSLLAGCNTTSDKFLAKQAPLYPYCKNNLWGFADDSASVRIAPQYQAVSAFRDGIAKVKINNKYGFINAENVFIVQPTLDWAWDCEQGKVLMQKDGKYGYLNAKGEIIIPIIYHKLEKFISGIAIAQREPNTKFGAIDESGRLTIPFRYEELFTPKDGFMKAKRDKKYGFLDLKGNEVVPFVYNQYVQYQNHRVIFRNGEFSFY